MNFLFLILQIALLGLIQGLTEFLPVSSSGHLVIAQHFLPLVSQQPVVLDIILHLGSLLALLIYFLPKLKNILKNKNLIIKVIVATLITVIIVFPFRKIIEDLFFKPYLSGIMLIITGIILLFASNKKENNKDIVGFKEAIIIGVSQAFAVLPGISRSGITISSGILSGLKSNVAIEFSFLLAIPIIAGAVILKIPEITSLSSDSLLIYSFGFIISFIVSLFTLKFLTKLLKINQNKLIYFAYYCFLIGLLVILFL